MKLDVLLLGMVCGPLVAGPVVHEGEIGGAKYMIAVPGKPAGNLVLLAHGYRPKENPISAKFKTDGDFARTLLAKGWVVASSSYRRNGWIIEDALEDLAALRGKVVELAGEPKCCVVVGNSMGGLIVVRAAEGAIPGVDGGVAVGAALQDYPKRSLFSKLTFKPTGPVVFLTNETELHYPREYRKREGGENSALWTVKRPGHCNVSDAERLAAVVAVNTWIDGGKVAREADGTVAPPRHASTAKVEGQVLAGTATAVSESWGNITTSFVALDVERMKLGLGDAFRISSDGGAIAVTLARHYSEVPEGQGVAFVTPDGFLRVQINGARASEKLKVGKGGVVRMAK